MEVASAEGGPTAWIIVADGDTEQPYYFNTLTNETSWEPPTEWIDADSATSATTMDSDIGIGNLGHEGAWEEVFDDESGGTYYFNATTNETSWEYPYADSDPSGPDIYSENESANHDGDILTGEDNIDGFPQQDLNSGSDWVAYTDEGGTTYYFNTTTNETSWEVPEDFYPHSEGEYVEDGMNLASGSDEIGDGGDVEWLERIDEISGNTYYENQQTLETQWESPYKTGGGNTMTPLPSAV